jgi:plasmid stabilization system protein ParE
MTARMVMFDDEYASRFDEFIASTKGDIKIVKDPNLEYDPYFYERKASLDRTIEAIDNGSMKMYNQEEYDIEMEKFMDELEKNMQIIRTPHYISELQVILDHISLDKFSATKKFKIDIDKMINNLVNFPFKFRQSYYYENENIRDMTFKGYSIIYRVNQEKDIIEILEIFNRNLPRLDNTYE